MKNKSILLVGIVKIAVGLYIIWAFHQSSLPLGVVGGVMAGVGIRFVIDWKDSQL